MRNNIEITQDKVRKVLLKIFTSSKNEMNAGRFRQNAWK